MTICTYLPTVCTCIQYERICVDICLKRIRIDEYHFELCMHASLPPSSSLHCPSGRQTRAGLMLGPLTAHTFTL